MISAAPTSQEHVRLQVLRKYDVLDTLPEEEYDALTRIAAGICQTPISLVSLVDEDRQWFKSRTGLSATETPREAAFCAHAILSPDEVFVVEDSTNDARFHDNPLVTGDPNIVFYAGVPLKGHGGYPLGTLCVIDHQPRQLSQQQINTLKDLAKQVSSLLDLRLKNKELEAQNKSLEKFAMLAAHDMKSPLAGVLGAAEILLQGHLGVLEPAQKDMVALISTASNNLRKLIDQLLEHSRTKKSMASFDEVGVEGIFSHLTDLYGSNANLRMTCNSDTQRIYTDEVLIKTVLRNLVDNAVKYSDKDVSEVHLSVREESEEYIQITVSDNGPGIPEHNHERVFQLFKTQDTKDRNGQKGGGVGLATAREAITHSGGTIHICKEYTSGTQFVIRLPRPKSRAFA